MGFRIQIDGEWTAQQFAEFFSTLDELNGFFVERMIPPAEFGRIVMFSRFTGYYDKRFALRVASVKYSSPGFTDLVGLAAVTRELREFVQYVIDSFLRSKDRKLDREIKIIEIAEKKVELLKRLLELESEYGSKIPPAARELLGAERGQLPNIDPIINAVLDGRIMGTVNSDIERQ